MCGIAGAFVFQNSSFSLNEPFITTMRDTMVHRGPDGGGTWVSPNRKIGLAHRRLSIIDLADAAAQPMATPDGSLRIVFNGEIYNHAEIRTELESEGVTNWLTSHSDTEVLLRAFRHWGIDCIHKMRGMFAFALWDAQKQELWLVRDRVGIKPLYYSEHHGRLTFASEIKALLKDPDQKRAVNETALYNYLSFLTTPAPDTLFEGIHKLPGGCWVRISSDGSRREERYWDVWDHTQPMLNASEDEVAEAVLAELETSVNYRKVSDVPVGVFLSGGIDSSTNAALFSRGDREPVRTFSIGYEGEYDSYQNELHYARRMADEVGADHHELKLNIDDLMDFVPRMVWLQDEPIADPVCVPVYYVSKLARDNGVIVCQVGEGADELFCGYPSWGHALTVSRWNRYPVPRFVKKLGMVPFTMTGRTYDPRHEWLRRASLGQPVFWGGAEAFYEVRKKQLLTPRLRHEFKDYTSWEALRPIYDRFQDKAWETSDINWMSYVDLNLRLPELLLMRVDKMSMGVSLEGRVPFLDHKFVELAMSIPAAMKTKNGTLKHILKKAVRGVIPDELIDRKKQGFGVPVYEWFFDRLGDNIRKELEWFCKEADILDHSAVQDVMEKGLGPQVWYLYNLALWWRQFIYEDGPDDKKHIAHGSSVYFGT